MRPTSRFDRATRFTGMLICMLSAIALLTVGVIDQTVFQYVMLGSYLVYSGADVADLGLANLTTRDTSVPKSTNSSEN